MIYYILTAIIAFASGVLVSRLTAPKQPPPYKFTMEYARLRRLAVRLWYLFGEGTLSKSKDMVRFEFHGDSHAASECFDAINSIIQIGSKPVDS